MPSLVGSENVYKRQLWCAIALGALVQGCSLEFVSRPLLDTKTSCCRCRLHALPLPICAQTIVCCVDSLCVHIRLTCLFAFSVGTWRLVRWPHYADVDNVMRVWDLSVPYAHFGSITPPNHFVLHLIPLKEGRLYVGCRCLRQSLFQPEPVYFEELSGCGIWTKLKPQCTSWFLVNKRFKNTPVHASLGLSLIHI